MKKQAISACLAGAMLASTIAGPALAVSVDEFTDVKSTDWFYPYVQKVAEKDYMIGVGGNLFAPATQMSRAMFVTVLARLEGVDEESAKSNFDDVPDDTWYTSAVNWAAANGIVEGNGAGQFMPEDEITRQDMCTMIARYVAYHQKKHNVTHVKPGTKKDFTDEDQIADYAAEFVDQCVAWGLIEGNDLGQFMPKSFTTRAEAAAVISRLSWKSNGGGGGGGVVPGDDEGDDTVTMTETKKYSVTATLTLPKVLAEMDPMLSSGSYNVSVTTTTTDGTSTYTSSYDPSTLDTVVNDLITEGMTKKDDGAYDYSTGTLSGYVTNALKRIQFDDGEPRKITKTVKGQEITIQFDTDGNISAKAVMNIADLLGTQSADGTSLFAASSTEEMKALIEKIQNSGGNLVINANEFEVLKDIVTEAGKINSQTALEDKLEQLKQDNPALEQALAGVNSGELFTAFDSYRGKLKEIQTEVQKAVDKGTQDEDGNYIVTVSADSVKMKAVSLNLVEYLKKADELYEKKENAAITRLWNELYPADEDGNGGKTISAEQKKMLSDLYQYNKPSKYVTKNTMDGTLKLLDAAAYVKMIVDNANKSMKFYSSLEEGEDFYSGLLTRLQNKSNNEGYGLTIDGGDNMAAILADTDCIFLDEYQFRDPMTFTVKVEAGGEDVYESWVKLITGQFDQLEGLLPGSISSPLLADYTLTLKITQTNAG